MTLVDRRPLLPHPYRQFDGRPQRPYGAWIRQWAEAEFLDANRWRDVVYVLVSFPLAILEFTVVVALWATAIGLVATPLLFAGLRSLGRPTSSVAGISGRRDRRRSWSRVLVGLVLVPVAASVSRGLMMHAPGGRRGAPVRQPQRGAAPGRGAAAGQPVGRPGAGGERAPAHRARPARRGAAAPGHAGDRPRPGRGPDRHGSRLREDAGRRCPRAGAPGARRAARPGPRRRAVDPAGPRARCGARCRRRPLPGADGPRQHPRRGRAAAPRRGAGRLLRGRRGARERRQAQPRRPAATSACAGSPGGSSWRSATTAPAARP